MYQHISVVGILVPHRAELGPQVQEVLTRHGDAILSRAGLPDGDKENGIITLTLAADQARAEVVAADLRRLPGVTAASLSLR
ncbi:MAG: hypothetical protein PWP43_475 [Bacillota bacterium]|nr:hypothetical protein [Bacillota bacterium]